MFPIIVNDGQTPFPEDDIFYIVCKEGVYLKKRIGVMDSVAPVKNISILESIQTSAKLHIKKIPATQAKQVVNFFKAVYKEHYSEAIVLLFYNIEKKHHKIICPYQEVTGGNADYTKGITIEGYDMIGTIHSHAGMSAFHSGTDDKDEDHFDGLHITFGNMRDDDISVSASIVANGHRVIVNPSDYINQMVKTVDIDEEVKVPYSKTWKWDKDKNKMVEIQTAGRFYTRKEYDQRYRVQLSKDPKFPASWMDKVEKKSWTAKTVTTGKDAWYGYGNFYEGSYWHGWRGHKVAQKSATQTNLPVTTKPGVKPTQPISAVVEKKEVSACDSCAFKDHKISVALDRLDEETKKKIIEWALDEIDQDANYVISEAIGENADDLSYYECVSCSSKFSVNESTGEAACPVCKTDGYLIEITPAEFMLDEDEVEEDKSNINVDGTSMNMIDCKACGSSFTYEFMNDGQCPTCEEILDVEAYDKAMHTVETDEYSTETENINIVSRDSGAYLNPDTEEIEGAIQDEDVERIPIPGYNALPINKHPRKPGVFAEIANLFNKRNKKK